MKAPAISINGRAFGDRVLLALVMEGEAVLWY